MHLIDVLKRQCAARVGNIRCFQDKGMLVFQEEGLGNAKTLNLPLDEWELDDAPAVRGQFRYHEKFGYYQVASTWHGGHEGKDLKGERFNASNNSDKNYAVQDQCALRFLKVGRQPYRIQRGDLMQSKHYKDPWYTNESYDMSPCDTWIILLKEEMPGGQQRPERDFI